MKKYLFKVFYKKKKKKKKKKKTEVTFLNIKFIGMIYWIIVNSISTYILKYIVFIFKLY